MLLSRGLVIKTGCFVADAMMTGIDVRKGTRKGIRLEGKLLLEGLIAATYSEYMHR